MSGPAWAGATISGSLRSKTTRRPTLPLLIALLTAALVPAAAYAQEFPLPNPGSQPSGITLGPDGALWFTEEAGNRIGRITTSGAITEFPIPTASSSPDEIVAGPDGRMWFTEFNGNKIGAIPTNATPGSGAEITEYSAGLTASAKPDGLTLGPDNRLWFTEFGLNKIGAISVTGVITEYPPAPDIIGGSGGPSDITAGPDGRLWFTMTGNEIGAITTTGTITLYSLPNPPDGITSSAGSLWFTESSVNKIGQLSTVGAVMNEFGPTGSGPSAIAFGPDGALWFTEFDEITGVSGIGRITTGGSITELPQPLGSDPAGITAGPDGALWFTQFAGNKIGRIDTAPPVTTLPLPPIKPLLPKLKPKRCTVPKLKGLTIKKAKKKLRRAKCRFRFSGKGRVVSSKPKAGKRTAKTVQVKAKPKVTRSKKGTRS